MDAKTMLLLGIGMAVLLLLGFCVVPSRSAGLLAGQQLPAPSGMTPGLLQMVEHPAMPGGLKG